MDNPRTRTSVHVIQPATSNIAPSDPAIPAQQALVRSDRLYYLDWVRVLALLVVCVVHVSEPFIPQSETFISSGQVAGLVFLLWALVYPWNPMALFFLVSGASSLFALNRRSPGQYVRERGLRLLAGQGWLANSMASPILFWVLGLHLWFLPFLFLISLAGLPILGWFRSTGANGPSSSAPAWPVAAVASSCSRFRWCCWP